MSEQRAPGVLVSRHGAVAVVTLNNSEKRNAIAVALSAELIRALDEIEADPQVKAIVVTGAAPAFSAGGDFADLLAARAGDPERLKKIYRCFLRLMDCRLPTIAAVNGPAIGAGLNLALACDVRIASGSARFETRFLKIGLHPGGGHTWMLSRAIGTPAAAAMLLFGDVLDGREAERIGLVTRCTGDRDVVAEAVAMAANAGRCPRELLETAKDTLRAATRPGATHEAILDLEYDRQTGSLQHAAFQETLAKIGVDAPNRNRT